MAASRVRPQRTLPSVSVIIPTFNRADFLPEAVASIRCQAHEPTEIIVVDDGSTDATRHVVGALGDGMRYRYRSNGGPAAACNTGIQMARGDVIAFLNSDDLWVEGALAARLARLRSHSKVEPPVDIVLGLTQRVRIATGEPGHATSAPPLPPWAATLFGSAVFRRSVFKQVGLLDESLRYGEDVDWFFRARERGVPMAFIKRVTLLYRLHQGNMTNDTHLRDAYFLRAIKRSLDRRRAVGHGRIRDLPDPANLGELLEFIRSSTPPRAAAGSAAESPDRAIS